MHATVRCCGFVRYIHLRAAPLVVLPRLVTGLFTTHVHCSSYRSVRSAFVRITGSCRLPVSSPVATAVGSCRLRLFTFTARLRLVRYVLRFTFIYLPHTVRVTRTVTFTFYFAVAVVTVWLLVHGSGSRLRCLHTPLHLPLPRTLPVYYCRCGYGLPIHGYCLVVLRTVAVGSRSSSVYGSCGYGSGYDFTYGSCGLPRGWFGCSTHRFYARFVRFEHGSPHTRFTTGGCTHAALHCVHVRTGSPRGYGSYTVTHVLLHAPAATHTAARFGLPTLHTAFAVLHARAYRVLWFPVCGCTHAAGYARTFVVLHIPAYRCFGSCVYMPLPVALPHAATTGGSSVAGLPFMVTGSTVIHRLIIAPHWLYLPVPRLGSYYDFTVHGSCHTTRTFGLPTLPSARFAHTAVTRSYVPCGCRTLCYYAPLPAVTGSVLRSLCLHGLLYTVCYRLPFLPVRCHTAHLCLHRLRFFLRFCVRCHHGCWFLPAHLPAFTFGSSPFAFGSYRLPTRCVCYHTVPAAVTLRPRCAFPAHVCLRGYYRLYVYAIPAVAYLTHIRSGSGSLHWIHAPVPATFTVTVVTLPARLPLPPHTFCWLFTFGSTFTVGLGSVTIWFTYPYLHQLPTRSGLPVAYLYGCCRWFFYRWLRLHVLPSVTGWFGYTFTVAAHGYLVYAVATATTHTTRLVGSVLPVPHAGWFTPQPHAHLYTRIAVYTHAFCLPGSPHVAVIRGYAVVWFVYARLLRVYICPRTPRFTFWLDCRYTGYPHITLDIRYRFYRRWLRFCPAAVPVHVRSTHGYHTLPVLVLPVTCCGWLLPYIRSVIYLPVPPRLPHTVTRFSLRLHTVVSSWFPLILFPGYPLRLVTLFYTFVTPVHVPVVVVTVTAYRWLFVPGYALDSLRSPHCVDGYTFGYHLHRWVPVLRSPLPVRLVTGLRCYYVVTRLRYVLTYVPLHVYGLLYRTVTFPITVTHISRFCGSHGSTRFWFTRLRIPVAAVLVGCIRVTRAATTYRTHTLPRTCCRLHTYRCVSPLVAVLACLRCLLYAPCVAVRAVVVLRSAFTTAFLHHFVTYSLRFYAFGCYRYFMPVVGSRFGWLHTHVTARTLYYTRYAFTCTGYRAGSGSTPFAQLVPITWFTTGCGCCLPSLPRLQYHARIPHACTVTVGSYPGWFDLPAVGSALLHRFLPRARTLLPFTRVAFVATYYTAGYAHAVRFWLPLCCYAHCIHTRDHTPHTVPHGYRLPHGCNACATLFTVACPVLIPATVGFAHFAARFYGYHAFTARLRSRLRWFLPHGCMPAAAVGCSVAVRYTLPFCRLPARLGCSPWLPLQFWLPHARYTRIYTGYYVPVIYHTRYTHTVPHRLPFGYATRLHYLRRLLRLHVAHTVCWFFATHTPGSLYRVTVYLPPLVRFGYRALRLHTTRTFTTVLPLRFCVAVAHTLPAVTLCHVAGYGSLPLLRFTVAVAWVCRSTLRYLRTYLVCYGYHIRFYIHHGLPHGSLAVTAWLLVYYWFTFRLRARSHAVPATTGFAAHLPGCTLRLHTFTLHFACHAVLVLVLRTHGYLPHTTRFYLPRWLLRSHTFAWFFSFCRAVHAV